MACTCTLPWPATCELRNSASRVGEGLDVRGEGGYVLAPGSIHPSCAVYAVAQNGPLTDAPDWLVKMAAAPMQRQTAEKGAHTADITRGGRHKRLAHVIGRMLHDGMAPGAIEAAALAENATFLPPKPEAEVRKLVADMAKRYPHGELPRSGFELVSLNTLLARGDTPVEYIWEGHLVSGTVSAVVSEAQGGKEHIRKESLSRHSSWRRISRLANT
jgi:Bifunctional DNA primase/polymerase, N-terminal